MSAKSQPAVKSPSGRTSGLIDCDIHNHLTPAAIAKHLPAKWQEYDRQLAGG